MIRRRKKRRSCVLNWQRYIGRKNRAPPGTLRILPETKADGGEDAKGSSADGRGSIPLQLWRTASENNAKISHSALTSLTDDCHLTDTLLSLESFQIQLPVPVEPEADGDSYREGSVDSQPCCVFCSVPQIDVLSSHGSKQGAWQKQLLLGNLLVPP